MRHLLLSLLCLPLAATLHAQDVAAGLKVGVNVSRFSNVEGFQERNSKAGLNVGGFVDVGFSDQLGLLTGLEYSQKGEREKNKIAGVDVIESVHLNYLDIPILLRYKPSSSVAIFTGPQIGFLASARFKRRIDGDLEDDVDINETFSGTDIAWVFGFYVPIIDRLWLDTRVQLGLTDIIDESGPVKQEASNQVIQFSLMIPLTN